MKTATASQGQPGRTGRQHAAAWRRAARSIAPLAVAALSVLAVDTSCTAPPHCPAGQHAQRAPSHQGHMWECAPDPGTR